MLASDYITQVRNNVHDQSSADFSDLTLLGFVNQARQRVALDTHCVRGFITGLNTITQQEQYPLTGFVGGVQVTAPGSGYSSAPAISFTGGVGSGAAATAVVTAGAISAINMTNWGTGYTSAPTVVFTGGGGTGAAATAIAGIKIIDILSITVLWGSLAPMLGWMPFTGFQAFCRAYRQTFATPKAFTTHTGIGQVFTYPISDQVYPMEWDVLQLPNDLVTTGDNDLQILPPWTDAVQYFAANLAIASLQNYDQADYWERRYEKRVRQLPVTVFSRRIYNPYALFARRMRRM